MVIRSRPNSGRWSAWARSGGLLVLVSIGLHGLLLAMPMPDADQPEEPITLLPPVDTTTKIKVIPLPDRVMRVPSGQIIAPPAPEATLATPRPQAQAELAITQTQPPTQPEPPIQPDPEPTPELLPPAGTTAPDVPPGLVYNDQVKTLRNDTQSFLEWYSDQDWGDDPAQMPPLPGPKELTPLRVSHSLSVCLNPPPAPGRLEVIVSPDGSLMRQPRLLATTGYDYLDAAAIEQATQQNFADAANASLPNPTVYWLPVNVVYDEANCAR